jgi:hypothetical protein
MFSETTGWGYSFEHFKSSSREHIHVAEKILTTFQRICSFNRETKIFREHLRCFKLPINVILGVQELAPVTIGAVGCSVELDARFCFIVRRQVSFFHNFMFPVCKRACTSEFASSVHFPISAHFGLAFKFVLSDEIISVFVIFETFLWLFAGGFFEKEFVRIALVPALRIIKFRMNFLVEIFSSICLKVIMLINLC